MKRQCNEEEFKQFCSRREKKLSTISGSVSCHDSLLYCWKLIEHLPLWPLSKPSAYKSWSGPWIKDQNNCVGKEDSDTHRNPPFNHKNLCSVAWKRKLDHQQTLHARPKGGFPQNSLYFFIIAVKADEDVLINHLLHQWIQEQNTYRILYIYTDISRYLTDGVPASKTNPWSSASFQNAGNETRTIQSFYEEHWSWASSKCHALRTFYNTFWNSDRL